MSTPGPTATMLLSCADRPGVVAAVSDFVARHGGNIVDAEQHTDRSDGVFLQRVEFELAGFDLDRSEITVAFEEVRARFAMDLNLHFSDERPRTAVLTSTAPHCLADVLARDHAGELDAEITLVASNHADHAELSGFFGKEFHHLPTGSDPAAQERAMIDLLEANDIELVVLARYRRILSDGFVRRWPNRIINIHHSFLPAFIGAQPYRQAHERGVKVIGATAHYVTAELDDGPIIEQDVAHMGHILFDDRPM